MRRSKSSSVLTRVLVLAVVGAVSGAAVAAERNVLGEYFTAVW
jgi:hypothetical protein